jgi:hypothetical protein
VLAARREQVTWQQIGDACGMTRSAAHDRWGEAAHRQTEKNKETAHVVNRAFIEASKPDGEKPR